MQPDPIPGMRRLRFRADAHVYFTLLAREEDEGQATAESICSLIRDQALQGMGAIEGARFAHVRTPEDVWVWLTPGFPSLADEEEDADRPVPVEPAIREALACFHHARNALDKAIAAAKIAHRSLVAAGGSSEWAVRADDLNTAMAATFGPAELAKEMERIADTSPKG